MLNHWSKMAKSHWKEHLPGYYQKLQKEGTLEQKLQEAGEKAKEMLAELMEQGMRRNEALEIVLPQFILLTPEKNLD
ncbi:MAG: TnpV protein [Fibrobacter sp.]|nr:TnpV protein [Fibrobacter sp.]